MSERLKFEGRLAQKDHEARGLQVQIRGLVESLRDLLDPFEKPEDLKAEQISDQALRLATRIGDYRQALDEIREIRRALTRG